MTCSCAASCYTGLPWGMCHFIACMLCLTLFVVETQAALRNCLFSMSQAEEAEWRRPFLQQHMWGKKVTFKGRDFCLKGFAITAGGSNYLRTCYRDIAALRNQSSFGESSNIRELRKACNFDSQRSIAIETYFDELVDQLAEVCPVTGTKILSVRLTSIMLDVMDIVYYVFPQNLSIPALFDMYLDDFESFCDEDPVSVTSFRRYWDKYSNARDVVFRENAPVGKCQLCISIKTRLLKVQYVH